YLNLAKVEVASSSLVSRSNQIRAPMGPDLFAEGSANTPTARFGNSAVHRAAGLQGILPVVPGALRFPLLFPQAKHRVAPFLSRLALTVEALTNFRPIAESGPPF
ncbi:MAG: hypothetical protein OEX13_12985, partial [Gammaproteobacteria bacterium]|nr:hypothetical protein [Gammaproteobacteria bacterium]